MVVLVDEGDGAAPQRGALGVGEAEAGLAIDQHLTAIRPLQQARDVQQGGLAGARGPDQCNDLAAGDLEGSILQHLEAAARLAEDAAHAAQLQAVTVAAADLAEVTHSPLDRKSTRLNSSH